MITKDETNNIPLSIQNPATRGYRSHFRSFQWMKLLHLCRPKQRLISCPRETNDRKDSTVYFSQTSSDLPRHSPKSTARRYSIMYTSVCSSIDKRICYFSIYVCVCVFGCGCFIYLFIFIYITCNLPSFLNTYLFQFLIKCAKFYCFHFFIYSPVNNQVLLLSEL